MIDALRDESLSLAEIRRLPALPDDPAPPGAPLLASPPLSPR
ncbi:hypothetical protein [Raineyella sp. LH-20]|nr:hypothetical protein [Raineyella sp. LH-20]WOP18134.1 hypothetical protein R0146_13000 [Raineyella sp. LH-20]